MIAQTTALRKIASLKKKIKVIQGGQGASKTFSILILLVNHASSIENREILILSAELTKMRLTVIKDFVKIMKSFGIYEDTSFIAGTLYRFPNGSFIKFIGLDKQDVGKGLRSHVAYFNEVNRIDSETYRQVATRADAVYCDYNPDANFFIHDEVVPRDDCDFIKLTFQDNEELKPSERDEILRYKDLGFHEDGEIKNKYWANMWSVYGLGEVGSIEGAVFENWEVGKFDKSIPFYYGLDFGFVNDPDACVKVAIDEKLKRIYVDEIFHVNGQKTDQLTARIKALPSGQVVADSAEQRLIDYLRTNSNRNIRAVKKGSGSVMQGIKLLQNYELIIAEGSDNLINELRNYKWNDKTKVAPLDAWNHLIDALRYVVWTYSARQFENQDIYEDVHTKIARGESVGSEGIEW